MLLRLCLILALLVPVTVSQPEASVGATCSGGLPEDMRERFELLAESAGAIVIAEITSSTYVARSLPPGVPDTNPTLTATFRQIAVLAQEEPITEFTIGPLRDMGPDCSGGPRLKAGDKALLFLIPDHRYELSYQMQKVAYWRIGVFGDTVLFRGPDAYYAHAFEGVYESAGPSRQVIQTILDVTDPPEDARRNAMAFLDTLPMTAPPLPPSPTPPPTLPVPARTPRHATSGQITPPDTGNAGLR